MLTTDCKQHQEFSTQIGGYFATVGLPFQRDWKYFDCVISPVACCAAGHRSIYKQDLHRFDVLQRRLLDSVVGPPRDVDWTQPWHEILHQWNGRIQSFMGQLKCKPWSEMRLQHHWNLAYFFALLPNHRWLKRVLHWNPCGRRRVGRPKNSWDSILGNFCRLKGLPSWEVAAMVGSGHRSVATLFPRILNFYFR